jgi:hypothetical protein
MRMENRRSHLVDGAAASDRKSMSMMAQRYEQGGIWARPKKREKNRSKSRRQRNTHVYCKMSSQKEHMDINDEAEVMRS